MAKRFTDNKKWNDEWFMDLPVKYKLFYIYLLDECDQAGIWKVNFKVASFFIGEKIDQHEALQIIGSKIEVLEDNYWFIKNFIDYQYSTTIDQLNPKNPLHKSVIKILKKFQYFKHLLSPIQAPLQAPLNGAKDKDMYKDKGIEDSTNLAITTEPELHPEHEKIHDLTRKVADYFNINEGNNYHRFGKIYGFIQFHFEKNKDDWLRTQLNGYWHHKQSSGEIKHGIDGFLGSYEHQYQDGAFYAKDWEKLRNDQKNKEKNGNEWSKEEYEKFKRNS